jgi:transcriptional regulator with XRE-family HTH domain
MHWGRAIRACRKAAGMTQQQLATRVGKSQTEIARLERRSDMLASTLELMALGLGVSCRSLTAMGDVAEDEGEET